MTNNKIVIEDINEIIDTNLKWGYFKNKTILISGANGFLPSYLVEIFLSLNSKNKNLDIKVIALVRNKKHAIERFENYLNDANFEILHQDVTEKIIYKDKIDVIIHAASQASPKFYGVDPIGTLKANILGTINLLDLALENNILSFLFFSSGEVYGEIEEAKIPTKEIDFGYLNPNLVRSCYAESKRMGENICVSYHHQHSIPVKIVRPFHTYGPNMKLDDGRVFADFVSNIVRNENIKMQSDGKAKRAFCYIKDASIGFLKVLIEGSNGEVYNVGNPMQEISILELAEVLIKLYPEKNLKIEKLLTKNDNNYLKSNISRNSPNIDKIKKLGWMPKTTVEEGFWRTIESFK